MYMRSTIIILLLKFKYPSCPVPCNFLYRPFLLQLKRKKNYNRPLTNSSSTCIEILCIHDNHGSCHDTIIKTKKFYSFPSKVKFKDLKLYLTILCTEQKYFY